ncbi:MAG TPA: LpqB family beta-propeller domain-containing protein, partial [Pyrinomonadaceae bacterium]
MSSTRADSGPQYSPDGRKVVFSSSHTGPLEVWACEADGSNPVQVTSFGGPHVGSPRWSPDGRQIVFDSPAEGHRDIYVVGVDGGKPRRLTVEASADVRPSWSRDGRFVYFGSDRGGGWQVWKAPAEGGATIQLTKGGGREAFDSPDGKFVYYTKADAPGLWRVPAPVIRPTLSGPDRLMGIGCAGGHNELRCDAGCRQRVDGARRKAAGKKG